MPGIFPALVVRSVSNVDIPPELSELVEVAELGPGQILVWNIDEMINIFHYREMLVLLMGNFHKKLLDCGIQFFAGSIFLKSEAVRFDLHGVLVGLKVFLLKARPDVKTVKQAPSVFQRNGLRYRDKSGLDLLGAEKEPEQQAEHWKNQD